MSPKFSSQVIGWALEYWTETLHSRQGFHIRTFPKETAICLWSGPWPSALQQAFSEPLICIWALVIVGDYQGLTQASHTKRGSCLQPKETKKEGNYGVWGKQPKKAGLPARLLRKICSMLRRMLMCSWSHISPMIWQSYFYFFTGERGTGGIREKGV